MVSSAERHLRAVSTWEAALKGARLLLHWASVSYSWIVEQTADSSTLWSQITRELQLATKQVDTVMVEPGCIASHLPITGSRHGNIETQLPSALYLPYICYWQTENTIAMPPAPWNVAKNTHCRHLSSNLNMHILNFNSSFTSENVILSIILKNAT